MPEVVSFEEFNETKPGGDRTAVMTQAEFMSMDPIEVDHSEFNDTGFFQTTPEQETTWKDAGEIGFIEAAQRQDKTEMIPFNPEGAVKSGGLFLSINRLKADNYEGREGQKSQDLIRVNSYLSAKEEERVRGYSIGGKIAKGAAVLPGFMLEFLATAGIATVAKRGTIAAAKKVVGDAVEKGVMKFTTKAVGLAAGAGVRTLAMPHKVAEGGLDRLINSKMVVTDKGFEVAKEATLSPATAFSKAFGDVMIENFSEVTGPAIGKVGSKLLPKQISNAFVKVFKRLHPNESVTKLFTKVGYNGFLEEMGEERVGDILRAVTGVEDFGSDGNVFDRIVASIPNGEQILVEAGVLSIPGASRVAISQLSTRFAKKKQPELVEMTDEKAQEIVDKEPEKEISREILPEEVKTKIPPEIEPTGIKQLIESLGIEELTEQDISPAEFLEFLSKNKITLEDLISDLAGKRKAEEIVEKEIPEIGPEFTDFLEKSKFNKEEILGFMEKIRQGEKLTDDQLSQVDEVLEEFRKSTAALPEIPEFEGTEEALLFGFKNKDIPGIIEALQKKREEIQARAKELTDKPDATPEEEAEAFRLIQLAQFPREAIEAAQGKMTPKDLKTIKDKLGIPEKEPSRTSKVKKRVREVTGQRKVEPKIVSERQALVQSLKDRSKAAKVARRFTQREIKELQEDIVDVINSSELSANDKSKFINTIKNIQTPEQFSKNIEDIEKRIDRLTQSAKARGLRSKIRVELKTIKAKKISGKPFGKFTPDIQAILERAREITKLTQEDALDEIGKKIESIGDGTPGFKDLIEIRLLEMMSGLEQRSPEDLKIILDDIKTLKATGTAEFLNKLFVKQGRKEELIDTALEVITGGEPITEDRFEGFKDRAKKILNTSYISLVGWNDKMDILSQSDASKADQSKLNKVARVSDEVTSEKKGIRIQTDKIREGAMKIFNFTDEKQLFRKFSEDSEIKELGTFTDGFGKRIRLQLSRAEARKRWMEFLDPSLQETFFTSDITPSGKKFGMGFTQDMVDAIKNFLNQEDMEFVEFQMKFYREFYNSVNKIYRDRYGVDLPFNEFYSPIRRKASSSLVSDEFLRETNFRRSIASKGSLKSRTKNFRPIAVTSDVNAIINHITEMEHFKNWADKIDDLNAIFGESEIRETIEKKLGKSMLRSIDSHIQDFTRGGIDRATNVMGIELLRINLTKSVLALKPSIAIKQMVSFLAFAENIPVEDFVSGVTDFMSDPVGKSKILMDSELLKSRKKDLTRDIKSVSKTEKFSALRENPTFFNSLLLNVRLGDRGAILLGGWAVYKHARKKGKTHEQAIKAFERQTAATQQSGDIDQLSDWQRGGSFAKLFTMFTSAQNQYFRREVGAIRNLISKRISLPEFTKKVAIYHFILPMLFQWVVDFGKWDEKHQWRAGILGSLNGIFILNDMLEGILGALFDERVFSSETPVQTVSRGIEKAINNVQNDEILEAIKDLTSETIGPVTGMPIKQIFNASQGVEDIADDDIHKGLLKLLGWSPYLINEGFKKKRIKR